jgi:predicted enzyme related to lactoylglutathione lyase
MCKPEPQSKGARTVANNLVFFAVHADDLARARCFYENVFGWQFQAWGPPGFFLVTTGTKDDPGVAGALQQRHELVPGKEPIGYECTIGVDDVDEKIAAVRANGGKVILPKCEIPTVGYLFKFQDTEGNVVCAKQAYDAKGGKG